MKWHDLRDVGLEDSLTLYFDGAYAQQSGLEGELTPFLSALERCGEAWMPDIVNGKRSRKYSRAAVFKALGECRTEYSSIVGLYRKSAPRVELTLHPGLTPQRSTLGVRLEVKPLSFFAEAERCRKLVDMVREWAVRYPVPYASAHSMSDEQLTDAPNFGRDDEATKRDGYDKVYEVFWLNVFGRKLVETVGRERMLSTPAHRVEELPDGSVLLVTWPTAADFASRPAREAQARALAHLRPDLDYATLLATLLGRSATLAPVEPRFHPDVAPLLTRTLDDFAISQRQRKIAEYNQYQPPEPEDWLPADAALPVDVDAQTAERIVERYSYFAETLVALLHTRVDSVFKQTPESLTDVDFQLWHEDFPERFARENLDAKLLPAVGAYLGEVLVRNLGGQWLPRASLGDAQVRVGSRVWFPMRRAWRYLRSTQSLLDSSLTQLYRVAARHRG